MQHRRRPPQRADALGGGDDRAGERRAQPRRGLRLNIQTNAMRSASPLCSACLPFCLSVFPLHRCTRKQARTSSWPRSAFSCRSMSCSCRAGTDACSACEHSFGIPLSRSPNLLEVKSNLLRRPQRRLQCCCVARFQRSLCAGTAGVAQAQPHAGDKANESGGKVQGRADKAPARTADSPPSAPAPTRPTARALRTDAHVCALVQ